MLSSSLCIQCHPQTQNLILLNSAFFRGYITIGISCSEKFNGSLLETAADSNTNPQISISALLFFRLCRWWFAQCLIFSGTGPSFRHHLCLTSFASFSFKIIVFKFHNVFKLKSARTTQIVADICRKKADRWKCYR